MKGQVRQIHVSAICEPEKLLRIKTGRVYLKIMAVRSPVTGLCALGLWPHWVWNPNQVNYLLKQKYQHSPKGLEKIQSLITQYSKCLGCNSELVGM